ncbi:MAG: hypothetical protein JNK72_26180 [Myxococcales bacterium]|nr:hypothetical protein [Myxococcales bacterium]
MHRREVSGRLRDRFDAKRRLDDEGRATKAEFLRLCAKARAVSDHRLGGCSTLSRHARCERFSRIA